MWFFFQISYCQGMSDIASPILAVMDNEAHAFICFCGIMKRLEGNFRPDGQLMSIKFQHLKLLLQYSDPEFYLYLVSRGADDLFFCYRWLLLELKREFAFEDALRMLEVTWSSLPPDPPETEVELTGLPLETSENKASPAENKAAENLGEEDKEQKEKQRRRHMLRPSREEPDMVRNAVVEDRNRKNLDAVKGREGCECAVSPVSVEKASHFERKISFGEFKYYTAKNNDSFDMEDEQPQGLVASKSVPDIPRRQSTVESEEDPGEKTPLIKNCENGLSSTPPPPPPPSALPIWEPASSVSPTSSASPSSWPEVSPDSPPKSNSQSTMSGREALTATVQKVLTSSAQLLSSTGISSPTTSTVKTSAVSPTHIQNRSLLSSPILSFGRGPSLPGGRQSPNTTAVTPSSVKADSTTIKSCSLPPPQEFGKGNPFMLFLCLSILLEHRDHIIKNSLDYNEIAMHFDRLVRRHNLSRVLQRAKALFADYLQSEVWDSEEGDEVSSDSPTTVQHSPSAHIPARPIYSPLASPHSSPNSTYNLATTIPSPTAQVSLTSTSWIHLFSSTENWLQPVWWPSPSFKPAFQFKLGCL